MSSPIEVRDDKGFVLHSVESGSLQGARLANVYLRKAQLAGADLRNANLVGADLREANLIGANLEGAGVDGIKLEGAWLEGATLNGLKFSEGANLRDTKFFYAKLIGAQFTRADFTGAQFGRANLALAMFHECNFEQAGLNEANLDTTGFYECSFDLTSFEKTNLSAVLRIAQPRFRKAGARFDRTTEWPFLSTLILDATGQGFLGTIVLYGSVGAGAWLYYSNGQVASSLLAFIAAGLAAVGLRLGYRLYWVDNRYDFDLEYAKWKPHRPEANDVVHSWIEDCNAT